MIMTDGMNPTTEEKIQAFVNNTRFVHFLCLIIPRRPGVLLFSVKLEYSYFPPNTQKNEEYRLHMINWEDMTWSMISIPEEYSHMAHGVADEVGVRIADGIPHTSTDGLKTLRAFPIKGNNVFTIENVKESEVYVNDSKIIQRLYDEEDVQIQRIITECWLPQHKY